MPHLPSWISTGVGREPAAEVAEPISNGLIRNGATGRIARMLRVGFGLGVAREETFHVRSLGFIPGRFGPHMVVVEAGQGG